MAASFYVLTTLCALVGAAPPAPPRLYQQAAPAQSLPQQINPMDFFFDNPELPPYYSETQRTQASTNNAQNGAPSRLETLDPDSEVELLPGAQQPQQPPQQTPVSPNLPGLVPGQRVFIVHMPVAGYRPGSIGGYQPVYIVAAGPQGNAGYPGNGYQNAVLLDPSGQTVISPLLGYPRVPQQAVNPGGYLLAPQIQPLNRPYEFAYQEPAGAYQAQPAPQGAPARPVQLSQLIALQTHAAHAANGQRAASNEQPQNSDTKRLAQLRESNEAKEAEDTRRGANARPLPAHAQNKP